MKRICAFAFAVLLLAACSIQKRQHLKGYHVDWNSKPSSKHPASAGMAKAVRYQQPVTVRVAAQELPLMAEAGGNLGNGMNTTPVSRHTAAPATATANCDILILRSGEEISANVSEITDDLVKYKR